ncbi:MAG: hypothetical protein MI749_15515 [Desulfovibrionales bacterium]|nr:hypothetical protein [Desulfovibrionales bacterium]
MKTDRLYAVYDDVVSRCFYTEQMAHEGGGMNLLIIGFCGLVFFGAAAGCNLYATGKMRDKIHASRLARRDLSNEINELQATLISKREEKKLAISKLRIAKSERMMQKGGMDIRPSSPRFAAGEFEQELVSQKVITPRELERVKNYRKSTACPYNLAETIVMLGYASRHDVDEIKAKYPQVK